MSDDSIDIRDEINRKATETLAQIMQDHAYGVASLPETRAAIAALFSATSGLTSQDVFELVSDASKEINTEKVVNTDRRLFTNGTLLTSLEYEWGEPVVTVKRMELGKSEWDEVKTTNYSNSVNPYEAAKTRFDQFVASFERLGFKELR
jgi:hypothetical protein